MITILFLEWKRGLVGVRKGKNVTLLSFSQIAQELQLNPNNQAPDLRKNLLVHVCCVVGLFTCSSI